MKKRERFVIPLAVFSIVASLAACADEKSEWTVYTNYETMSEASRDYLINCLDDRSIEVKTDGEKNILIHERDKQMAAASCS